MSALIAAMLGLAGGVGQVARPPLPPVLAAPLPTPAPATLRTLTRGRTIVDRTGAAAGTIVSADTSTVLLNTGKSAVRLPATAFKQQGAQIAIPLSTAEIDEFANRTGPTKKK